MVADRESGTLFSANRDLVLLDQFADVFKSHWGLMQLDPVMPSHGIDQVGGSHGFGHTIFPAPAFDQVVEQQCNDVVGGAESAVGIYDAETVCVSVGGDAEVRI